MATVPNPKTWVDSEIVTPTMLNTEIRDALNFVLSPPRVSARISAATAIATSTDAQPSFDLIEYDTDGFFSAGSPHRITINTAGLYHVIAQVGYDSNSTGRRTMQVWKNGSANPIVHSIVSPPGGGACIINACTMVRLVAGDYLQLDHWQNSGASLSTQSQYSDQSYLQLEMVSK